MTKSPIHPLLVAAAVALFGAVVLNVVFWQRLIGVVQPSVTGLWHLVLAIGIIVTIGYGMVLTAIAHPKVFRPVTTFLLILSSGLAYLAHEYGIGASSMMLRTALETNRSEAFDLITPKLVLFVIGLGVPPPCVASMLRATGS